MHVGSSATPCLEGKSNGYHFLVHQFYYIPNTAGFVVVSGDGSFYRKGCHDNPDDLGKG